MILERFFPDLYIQSVYELPLQQLQRQGIQALVFDIDNTIAPFDVAEPDDALIDFFAKLKKMGFRVCILSNNNKARVQLFNRNLKLLAVHKAGKPSTKKVKRVLEKMHILPKNAAIIGDQVFTDMWCGHQAGMYCIMTAPICNRDQFATKIKRGLERCVMRIYFKRNGIK